MEILVDSVFDMIIMMESSSLVDLVTYDFLLSVLESDVLSLTLTEDGRTLWWSRWWSCWWPKWRWT